MAEDELKERSAETAAEPAAGPVGEPAAEPAGEPAAEPAGESAAKTEEQPGAQERAPGPFQRFLSAFFTKIGALLVALSEGLWKILRLLPGVDSEDRSTWEARSVRTPVSLVFANLRGLVNFEIQYRLLCLFVFFPVLIYIERLLLVVNGYTNITWENTAETLRNPLTWLTLVLLVVAVTLFAEIEQFSIISAIHASYSGRRIVAREALLDGVDLTLQNIRLRNAGMVFFFMLVFPFSQLFDSSSITRFIQVPGFILEHFEKYPAIGTAFNVFCVLMTYIGFRWSYAMTDMAVRGHSFPEACRRSMQLTKGRRGFRLVRRLLLWILQLVLFFLLFTTVAVLLVLGVVHWLEPGHDLLSLITENNASLFIILVALVFGWFVEPIFKGIILSLYYHYEEEDGLEIPLYQKRSHILQRKGIRAVAVLLCMVCMFFSVPQRYRQFRAVLQGNAGQVMIMAHRGFSAKAPENTIPAFQAAIDCGAKAVELDVQMTKDGEIVVLHDDSLERTAGLRKHIWDVTYDEIKDLDNGSFFSPEYKGTKIPTLEEALRFAKGRLYVNIEIKRTGHDDGIEERVIEIIRKCDFVSECDVTSQDYSTLQAVRAKDPDILLAYTSVVGIGDVQNLECADILSIQETFATYDTVEAMHRAGKKVFVWTVNEETSMEHLVNIGVDAILTNDPVLGQSVLEKHRGVQDFYLRLQSVLFYLS